jgi:hypothetical protein
VTDRTNWADWSSNNTSRGLMLHRARMEVDELRMDRTRAVVKVRGPARR